MKTTLNNLAGAGLPSLGVKRPWLVTVMNLLIAIAGLVAMFAIEVRELPDVDEPVVNVRANFPGASPETMDAEVTRILEGAVARVSGVKEVNSNSEEGNTRIRAVFNPSSNVDRAAADVREAISRVQRQLPDSVEQLAVFKADEDAEEIMRVAVMAEDLSEQDLATVVERDVVPAFISLPGVADVPLFGSRRQILRVELDPGRLSTYGLTVTDVRAVLSQAPLDVPAGSFKTSDQTLLVRADAAVDSEADIGNLLLTDKVRLKDVARIAYTPDDATSIVRLNGQRILGVGIVRQAGSNTIQISGRPPSRSAFQRTARRYKAAGYLRRSGLYQWCSDRGAEDTRVFSTHRDPHYPIIFWQLAIYAGTCCRHPYFITGYASGQLGARFLHQHPHASRIGAGNRADCR